MSPRLGVGAVAAALATVLLSGSSAVGKVEPAAAKGTFRVISCTGDFPPCVDSIDPALAAQFGSLSLEQTTCASLVRYPDKPPPAGYRLVPELAAALPRFTGGGHVYTFRIRKGLRFSTGLPVT